MLTNLTFALIPEKEAIWIFGQDHVPEVLAKWVEDRALDQFKDWDLIWLEVDSITGIAPKLNATLQEEGYIPSQILISIGQRDFLKLSTANLRETFQNMFQDCSALIKRSPRQKCTANMLISPVVPQLVYPTYNKQSAAKKKWLGINRKINALCALHQALLTPSSGISIGSPHHFAGGDSVLSPEALELLAHSWLLAITSNMC